MRKNYGIYIIFAIFIFRLRYSQFQFFYKGEKMKPILMSTPVLVVDGTYRFSSISIAEAKEILKDGFVSAVGHQSSAEMLSDLLELPVPMSRITLGEEHFQRGQKAVVLKLLRRPPEGAILDITQVKECGFAFKLLEVL